MTQFLRVRAERCQLVIDCDYVQEVAIWNDNMPPAKEALWHDAVLQGASLTEMLGLADDRVTAAIILRDPASRLPLILLGVSEIEGLMDLTDSNFRPVLNEQSASSYTRTATFSQDIGRVLLKLDVEALLPAKNKPNPDGINSGSA